MALLKAARVASFRQVCKAIRPGEHDVGHVLTALQRHAHMVHGNWACRSKLLYSGNAYACDCRDFLLSQLSGVDDNGQPVVIDRLALSKAFKLGFTLTRELFSELAVRVGVVAAVESTVPMWADHAPAQRDKDADDGSQWHFKLEPDEEFLAQFGGILSAQTVELKNMGKRLAPQFPLGAAPLDDLEATVIAAVDSLLITFGVCSRAFLARRLPVEVGGRLGRALPGHVTAALEAALLAKAKPLQDSAGVPAVGEVGSPEELFFKAHTDNPETDKLREIIAGLLSGMPLIGARPARGCKKSAIVQGVQKACGETLSEAAYKSLMKEFAEFNKGHWVLKPGDYAV